MDEKEPTEETQPKKGEPITIPVPARDEIDAAISKVAQPIPPKPKKRHRKAQPIVDPGAHDRARDRSGRDVRDY
ncbi:MAG TPA: hypothetical protein VFW97_10435 [Acidimicrobiia bacterium]|nr:hypothetical protein [Acidimicrobiia bacterium]